MTNKKGISYEAYFEFRRGRPFYNNSIQFYFYLGKSRKKLWTVFLNIDGEKNDDMFLFILMINMFYILAKFRFSWAFASETLQI